MLARPDPGSTRISSIDQLRVLSIVLMVLANYLTGVNLVPPLLKHAPDVGLPAINLLAPLFRPV
jgi:predicted acyltransferase